MNSKQYDKDYYEKMLLRILEPVKQHFSQGKSRLELGSFAAGYGMQIAGMEGFSRILWGLVPYWAGGGQDKTFLSYLLEGLSNGTDPKAEEYWGRLHNKDQRMVEMAAISNALLLVPELLWDPLTELEKDNLANWLYQINEFSLAENNWQFFNVLTNLALKKHGRKYSRERMSEAIEKYESFYLGNGWYSDGKRPQRDYYSSFAIQYYCLLYAYYEGEEDPERADIYRHRAVEFAESFQYWFDDQGKALPFGRSLTYRFAQAAFFSACIMTEVEALPYGVMKGILGRHLRYWMEQPIFDHGGILTVGYTYPNLMMSEGYNSPGSPYWALKAFAFLRLPAEHPFWQLEEALMPRRAAVKLLPEAQMLIADRPGEIIALTAGQYSVLPYAHDAEKYEKFAYSSRFGFSVPRSYCNLNECAPDSMLAFELADYIYVRRRCIEYRFSRQEVWARWSPTQGIEVETTLLPIEGGHIRRHIIKSQMQCKAYDCGFAYPFCQEKTTLQEDGNAIVSDQNGYSKVECRSGNGHGKVILAAPNTNLIFPLTAIPAIEYEIAEGITEVETWILTEFQRDSIRIGGDCYEIYDK